MSIVQTLPLMHQGGREPWGLTPLWRNHAVLWLGGEGILHPVSCEAAELHGEMSACAGEAEPCSVAWWDPPATPGVYGAPDAKYSWESLAACGAGQIMSAPVPARMRTHKNILLFTFLLIRCGYLLDYTLSYKMSVCVFYLLFSQLYIIMGLCISHLCINSIWFFLIVQLSETFVLCYVDIETIYWFYFFLCVERMGHQLNSAACFK